MILKIPYYNFYCETEVVAKGQMMTNCPSERSNLWNRRVCKGINDDQMSFKETIYMNQKCSRRVKWLTNCPSKRPKICETKVVAKGQLMTNCPSKRPNMCETEVVAKGQIMTKCPSKRPNIWNRRVRKGLNDDQMSFKETIYVNQKCSRRFKWLTNCPSKRQKICEAEVVAKGQLMTNCPSKRKKMCETEVVAKGQIMTKCPAKRPNLWNRSGGKGSSHVQMSFKETKFMKHKWWRRVKSCPNVLQRDQICEKEVFARGQILTKWPSKRPNLWSRSGGEGSNHVQMSFKVATFMKQKWWRRVKWWPNVLQRDQISETDVFAKG